MMNNLEFGIKVASFPSDGVNGPAFIEKIFSFIRETDEKFSTVWVSDHLAPWTQEVPRDADTLECWTTVCYLSGAFPNKKFGTSVLSNSFRNPALLAKMVASLYGLSGGRYVLGIGAGWREEEYIEYGIPFSSAAIRIKQLSEGVQIIKKLWTEDNVTFNGEYFQVNNLSCHPHPTPTPPIMIGGGGEQLTLRVVAKYADWWNIGAGSLKLYKHKLKILSKHCSKVNRDFNEIRKTVEALICIRETKKEAKEASSINRRSHFVGTPEEAVHWLNGFVATGVDYFILRFLDEPNTVGAQLFSERVIPELI